MYEVRSKLFERDGTFNSDRLIKLLARSAEMGNHEAIWLMGKLHGGMPNDQQKMWSWMVTITEKDNTPWAKYYTSSALGSNDPLLYKESAEAGFAPAMTKYAMCMFRENPEESDIWIQKAANLNEPRALYWSVMGKSGNFNFDLLKRGAEQCHSRCIFLLLSNYSTRLLPVERARFNAMYVLYGIHPDRFDEKIIGATDGMSMFVAGRVLSDHVFFWQDAWIHPHESYMKCIGLYKFVTKRARRAALQALVVLRGRIGRDVSLIIAKIIYRERHLDIEEWLPSCFSNDYIQRQRFRTISR